MKKDKFPFSLPLVLDGATGTELIKAGMPAGANVQAFVLDNPDVIKKIQTDYYNAGSDAVYACTFGATPRILEENGVLLSSREICMLVSKISRQCAKDRLVGGSLAPCGAMFYPMGDDTFDFAVGEYTEAVQGMEHYVDFFTAETCISALEAKACVMAVKKVSEKPVFVTLTVDKNGRTLCGDEVVPTLLMLASVGISGFGLNCSFGPDIIIGLLEKAAPYAEALGIQLIAKPNAGLPSEDGTFDLTVDEFASYIPRALDCGIGILGGCCGTDKEHIRRIRQCVDTHPLKQIKACELDFENTVCNTRSYALVDRDNMPTSLEISDYLYEDIEDQAEKYGYGLVKIEKGQTDALNQQLAYINAPIALCGDREEAEKFAYSYGGKTVFIEE
ncbi:MAG: homocysteine S-methyltransferase family protein [Clostridia bacterium]|nr:homocysteine S-methyltransferase family protein [Clostridia bacterium]